MSENAKMTEQDKKNEFRKMLVEEKKTSESYVTLSIYKSTELYEDTNLTIEEFDNIEWKFFYSIAKKLIDDDKKVLDDIVVGLKVSENEQLQKMYDDFGGWDTIKNGVSFVQEQNFDGYVRDLKKTNALIQLHDLGFPIMQKYDAYRSQSVEDIQQTLEGVLSSVFADMEVEEKVEDIKDGLWDTVMDAHAGNMRGFPYASPMLNEYTNGQKLGNISMVSANSGMGKSTFVLMQVLPNMIEYNERLMILANEEDRTRWQQQIITWAVNNVFDGEFNKSRFNFGEFSQDELDLLKQGVDWLNEKMEDGTIRFINFNSFNMDKAIKTIKKESSINDVKYFVIDTLKLDSDAINSNVQSWLALQQSMVKLYDVIKPSNRNLSVTVTYQLGKSAMLSRYLDQSSLGMSKNVVDVVSVLMLARKALESEKKGGKNEIKVKTSDGKIVEMEEGKDYFIVFLGKNRMGGTGRQLVYEVNMGTNVIKDFGTCVIEQDI